jgi:hypothetical protein
LEDIGAVSCVTEDGLLAKAYFRTQIGGPI